MAAPHRRPRPRRADALAARAPRRSRSARQPPTRRARAAQDFEAVFLNTMFSRCSPASTAKARSAAASAAGVWRSFLTDEYSKTFAKAGGIGIADSVYRALIAQQEARAK